MRGSCLLIWTVLGYMMTEIHFRSKAESRRLISCCSSWLMFLKSETRAIYCPSFA